MSAFPHELQTRGSLLALLACLIPMAKRIMTARMGAAIRIATHAAPNSNRVCRLIPLQLSYYAR